jgi:hypothetical protein
MYTLTIAQAIRIALFTLCPLAQSGFTATATDLFGTHLIITDYGPVNIQVGTANEEKPSALAVGSQYIFIRNAPLIRVLELMERPIAPCPLTAYSFGRPPSDEVHPEEKSIPVNALLAETINFKISCSDCYLEDLQEVAFNFLQSKIRAGEKSSTTLPLAKSSQ